MPVGQCQFCIWPRPLWLKCCLSVYSAQLLDAVLHGSLSTTCTVSHLWSCIVWLLWHFLHSVMVPAEKTWVSRVVLCYVTHGKDK